MTYTDVQELPEVLQLKPQLEAAGIDYRTSVEKATDAAYNRAFAHKSDREEIITFVINFLTKLIDERMSKPAKTKAGGITRFLWSIARLFGFKQKVIEAANSL